MDIGVFFKGLIIGVSIAAPVGPIGVLCIQRTLSGGRLVGLISGLGAASADAVYGCIAAFGLTLISNLLVEQQFWFRAIGGGFLCYLGIKTLLSKPAADAVAGKNDSRQHLGAYGSTFVLTLTNPMTILAFAAIFAGLGIGNESGHDGTAVLMVLGVFLGSAMWWCILSGLSGLFHGKFDPRKMLWINRISGTVVTTFGVLALASIIYH
ncbi:MAG: LysE family translocator [bacterium]|nr:LysE family translocator [bacterium]